MLYFNATLFGRKAMGFLAELDPDNKPDAIAFVEVHLRGTDLNATRRRVKQLGWRMMATLLLPSRSFAKRQGNNFAILEAPSK